MEEFFVTELTQEMLKELINAKRNIAVWKIQWNSVPYTQVSPNEVRKLIKRTTRGRGLGGGGGEKQWISDTREEFLVKQLTLDVFNILQRDWANSVQMKTYQTTSKCQENLIIFLFREIVVHNIRRIILS